MNLLRIAFAVIVGLLVYALLKWLATSIPVGIDALLGVVAAFIAYFGYTNFPNRA